MEKENNILDLFRKIICSLLCIKENTKNDYLKNKASHYLDKFLKEYELYYNQKNISINNSTEIIDFCNECYEDKDVFDYAEDVQYGLEELNEIVSEGGNINGKRN